MMLYLLIVCSFIAVVKGEPSGEPMFLSRFDYDYKVLSKLVELDYRLKQVLESSVEMDNKLKQVSESSELEGAKLRQQMKDQQREIEQLTAHIDETGNRKNSAATSNTYVRWGRTSCPANGTQLVYSGYVGGSYYSNSGAAVDYICLPKDPQWNKYKDGLDSNSGFVYGAEYELDHRDLVRFFGRNIRNGDVPCAVCSTDRPNVLMIPGRNLCYDDWTVEYHGYLTSGYFGHSAASQYVCLDGNPDSIQNTESDKNGKLFYFVEARCGSLPCPPYVEGRELTCVVCSK